VDENARGVGSEKNKKHWGIYARCSIYIYNIKLYPIVGGHFTFERVIFTIPKRSQRIERYTLED